MVITAIQIRLNMHLSICTSVTFVADNMSAMRKLHIAYVLRRHRAVQTGRATHRAAATGTEWWAEKTEIGAIDGGQGGEVGVFGASTTGSACRLEGRVVDVVVVGAWQTGLAAGGFVAMAADQRGDMSFVWGRKTVGKRGGILTRSGEEGRGGGKTEEDIENFDMSLWASSDEDELRGCPVESKR